MQCRRFLLPLFSKRQNRAFDMYSFFKDETGAVTVDWVVLTAGLVGLGLAVMTVVSSGVEDLATDLDEEMSTQVITTSFPTVYPPFSQSDYTYSNYHLYRFGERTIEDNYTMGGGLENLITSANDSRANAEANLLAAIASGDVAAATNAMDQLAGMDKGLSDIGGEWQEGRNFTDMGTLHGQYQEFIAAQ